MFTGIVQAIGTVELVEPRGGDLRLRVTCDTLDLSDLHPGDSIAVNGVCLSAIEISGGGFGFDVSLETLACTTLGKLTPGSRVNLEMALLPTTRLSGHLVSGHVDGVGEVKDVCDAGRSRTLRIEIPAGLARYVAAKGSIGVDGVSLTVNEIAGNEFTVNIIPHTLEQTNSADYRRGSAVNIEVDIIARYLEGLLRTQAAPAGVIDRAFLIEHGYINDA